MTKLASAAFARGLKDPGRDLVSIIVKRIIFGIFNRQMNRFAVQMCDLKPGQRVLDVGCGVGVGMRYALPLVAPRTVAKLRRNPLAAAFGPQWPARLGLVPFKIVSPLDADGVVYGIDTSDEMVLLATNRTNSYIKANRARVYWASVAHIPLANNHLDAVFHVESFPFWPSVLSGLAEIHRVLRPGGLLVTAFAPRRFERFSRWGWFRYGRPDPLAYAIALERVGFTDVEWIRQHAQAPRGVHCIRAKKPPLKLLTAG